MGGKLSDPRLLKLAGLGRFQVMALLQAARYFVLYGDEAKAKSFGLNRAIFYAWAKHYGPRGRPVARDLDELLRKASRRRHGKCPEGFVEVAGDCVQVSPRGWYMIGGQEQTDRDFEREVVLKVRKVLRWEEVWEAALEYVKQFPEHVLKDPQKFYKLVYEPVRDTFFELVARGEKPRPPTQLVEKLRALEEAVRRAERAQTTLTLFLGEGREGGKAGSSSRTQR